VFFGDKKNILNFKHQVYFH